MRVGKKAIILVISIFMLSLFGCDEKVSKGEAVIGHKEQDL